MKSDSAPSAALLAEIAADHAPQSPPDKLDALRAECERLRDDVMEIEDLTTRLETATARRQKRVAETIPGLMDEARVPSITLAAAGNLPSVTVSVRPYYRANIAADWEPEKRKVAFDWLDANGCGDLIKTSVSARFAREDRARALEVVAMLREAGVSDVEVDQAVAWATLTSWLKKRHEDSLPLPPLDVIGGTVGRVAEIKPVKEKR
jgi:hypothetical protein